MTAVIYRSRVSLHWSSTSNAADDKGKAVRLILAALLHTIRMPLRVVFAQAIWFIRGRVESDCRRSRRCKNLNGGRDEVVSLDEQDRWSVLNAMGQGP